MYPFKTAVAFISLMQSKRGYHPQSLSRRSQCGNGCIHRFQEPSVAAERYPADEWREIAVFPCGRIPMGLF